MIDIPIRSIAMPASADVIKAPFVAVGTKNIIAVEGNQDAAFRNALVAMAPHQARKHFLDGFINGPKGDGGQHARVYFGHDKIEAIQAHIHPLTEEIEKFMAGTLRFAGFNRWLTLTGWGDDYRIIKGLMAWADLQKGAEGEEDRIQGGDVSGDG